MFSSRWWRRLKHFISIIDFHLQVNNVAQNILHSADCVIAIVWWNFHYVPSVNGQTTWNCIFEVLLSKTPHLARCAWLLQHQNEQIGTSLHALTCFRCYLQSKINLDDDFYKNRFALIIFIRKVPLLKIKFHFCFR